MDKHEDLVGDLTLSPSKHAKALSQCISLSVRCYYRTITYHIVDSSLLYTLVLAEALKCPWQPNSSGRFVPLSPSVFSFSSLMLLTCEAASETVPGEATHLHDRTFALKQHSRLLLISVFHSLLSAFVPFLSILLALPTLPSCLDSFSFLSLVIHLSS